MPETITSSVAFTTIPYPTADQSHYLNQIYNFSDWTECSVICGHGGLKSRPKTCTAGCTDIIEDIEFEPCNTAIQCDTYTIAFEVELLYDVPYDPEFADSRLGFKRTYDNFESFEISSFHDENLK